MPTVFIPPMLREMTGGRDEIAVDGRTVREAIDNLESKAPGIRARLVEGDKLKGNLAVAIDGEVSVLGLRDRVEPDSEIHFVAALSGG